MAAKEGDRRCAERGQHIGRWRIRIGRPGRIFQNALQIARSSSGINPPCIERQIASGHQTAVEYGTLCRIHTIINADQTNIGLTIQIGLPN